MIIQSSLRSFEIPPQHHLDCAQKMKYQFALKLSSRTSLHTSRIEHPTVLHFNFSPPHRLKNIHSDPTLPTSPIRALGRHPNSSHGKSRKGYPRIEKFVSTGYSLFITRRSNTETKFIFHATCSRAALSAMTHAFLFSNFDCKALRPCIRAC